MEGAVVAFRGELGEAFRVELSLGPDGRTARALRASGRVGADGVAAFRVPYAASGLDGGAVRVRLRGRVLIARPEEAEVRAGNLVKSVTVSAREAGGDERE